MPLNLFGKQTAKAVNRKESLESVVVQNEAIAVERAGSGDVTLTVHRDTSRLLAKLMVNVFGLPKQRKIILDKRGTFVWDMCDGKTTLREMISRFAKEFTLNRKETEVLIVEYIKSLARRGLAGIVVKRNKDGE